MMTPRLRNLILIGTLVISVTIAYFYGHSIFLELTTNTIIGKGDSLMASSDVLARVEEKLKNQTGENWTSKNSAVSGYRLGIEVLRDETRSYFGWRFAWKYKDKVWLIAGTNDFGLQQKNRVERLLSDVEEFFKIQNQRGYPETTCFYTNLLPRLTPGDDTFESDRVKFNSLVAERLTGLARVVPSGSNPLLSDPKNTNIFYDGTHLTAKGNEILASDFLAALDR